MLWIALYLPDLSLQALTRGLPDPGELAVVEHRPRPHVVAVSPAARAKGVEPGLRLAGALALSGSLVLCERDPDAEVALLETVACWAGQFSPSVSLDPPDTVLIEVASCMRLFDGLAALVIAITSSAKDLGVEMMVAAAPTPLAARWIVHAAPDQLVEDLKALPAVLNSLPVTMICNGGHVPPAVLELMQGIGIQRLGELGRLPRDGLARRDAACVTTTLGRALGNTPDPRPWYIPPPRHANRLVLPAPIDHTEPLLFACRRQLASLCAWLDGQMLAIDHCEFYLEHENLPDTLLEIVTGHPSWSQAQIELLLREHLNRLELKAPVEAIRLQADNPLSRPAISKDLFGDPNDARDSAARLVARLCARLGKDAVRSLQARPDHRPEAAWQSAPPGCVENTDHDFHQPRPTWLLSKPRALRDTAHLTLLHGPERIESGWWDGKDVRRDYYVARSPEAAMWWIFRNLDEPNGWYIHGYFA